MKQQKHFSLSPAQDWPGAWEIRTLVQVPVNFNPSETGTRPLSASVDTPKVEAFLAGYPDIVNSSQYSKEIFFSLLYAEILSHPPDVAGPVTLNFALFYFFVWQHILNN